ncbi:MAG: pentapeptide repeat-containing protein [Bacteroidota bacterium]|nr:pentapeptide repeat-containing protein [Bacteroidota bacterium]
MNNHLIYILIIILSLVACSEKDETNNSLKPSKTRQTIVQASAINSKLEKGEDVYYANSVIVGEIKFTETEEQAIQTPQIIRHYSNSSVFFSNCTFQGALTAYKRNEQVGHFLQFSKNLSFLNCTFQSKVNFSEADFSGAVLFRHATFQDSVSFQGASFNYKHNYFNLCMFYGFTDFSRTRFLGKLSAVKSEFHENLLFSSSMFVGDVNFAATSYFKKSVFTSNSYRGQFLFRQSQFSDKATFNNSQFFGEAYFSELKSDSLISIQNCRFINLPDTSGNYNAKISLKDSRYIETKSFDTGRVYNSSKIKYQQ